MEEKEQPQQPTDEQPKQQADGEYTLEELDRRIPFRPHEKSDDAWA